MFFCSLELPLSTVKSAQSWTKRGKHFHDIHRGINWETIVSCWRRLHFIFIHYKNVNNKLTRIQINRRTAKKSGSQRQMQTIILNDGQVLISTVDEFVFFGPFILFQFTEINLRTNGRRRLTIRKQSRCTDAGRRAPKVTKTGKCKSVTTITSFAYYPVTNYCLSSDFQFGFSIVETICFRFCTRREATKGCCFCLRPANGVRASTDHRSTFTRSVLAFFCCFEIEFDFPTMFFVIEAMHTLDGIETHRMKF